MVTKKASANSPAYTVSRLVMATLRTLEFTVYFSVGCLVCNVLCDGYGSCASSTASRLVHENSSSCYKLERVVEHSWCSQSGSVLLSCLFTSSTGFRMIRNRCTRGRNCFVPCWDNRSDCTMDYRSMERQVVRHMAVIVTSYSCIHHLLSSPPQYFSYITRYIVRTRFLDQGLLSHSLTACSIALLRSPFLPPSLTTAANRRRRST